jgi:RNA polymerase sigma-70 factor (ECF subfamily)
MESPHQLTDEELVWRAQNGSDAAFGTLADRYAPLVYRLAFEITKSRLDAEDVVQETLLKAFRHIGEFSSEKASFKTWILMIARNQSVNVFHALARKATRFFSEDTTDETNPVYREDSVLLEPLNPESLLETKQELRKLNAALKALPERQRTALLLKTREALSYEDIATVLKSSASSVESLIYRARQNLLASMRDS